MRKSKEILELKKIIDYLWKLLIYEYGNKKVNEPDFSVVEVHDSIRYCWKRIDKLEKE